MNEPIHPGSRETLRALIKLHGAERIIDAAKEIEKEEAQKFLKDHIIFGVVRERKDKP